jgi:hypothetical protein
MPLKDGLYANIDRLRDRQPAVNQTDRTAQILNNELRRAYSTANPISDAGFSRVLKDADKLETYCGDKSRFVEEMCGELARLSLDIREELEESREKAKELFRAIRIVRETK